MTTLVNVCLSIFVIAAALRDGATHRIPNPLVLAGAATGVGLQSYYGGLPGLLESLEGLAVGLVIMLPFYIIRVMGAGDVKLMAAVGAFLGPTGVLGATLCSGIVGGLLAIGVAVYRRQFARLLSNVWLVLVGSHAALEVGQLPTHARCRNSVGDLPYAVAIAFGVFAWLLYAHVQGAGR